MNVASRVSRLALPIALPVLAAGLCGRGLGQTASPPPQRPGLPATHTTQTTGFETPARAATSSQGSTHRAEVHYANGLLTVTARDSSLNAILREIAQQTGMKISGGVRDDRVFGTYGPDQPSAVLSTLLDGSGSNMLLVNNIANTPAQLILSPRVGGPTPPSEFAANRQQQDQDNEDGAPVQPRFGAQGPPPGIRVGDGPGNQLNAQPGANLSPGNLSPSISPSTTNNSDSQAVVFPPVSATTTPATATTSSDVTQEAPGGVKTPQQIFEQLQRMRQQQEQTQPQETTNPQ